MSEPFCRLDLSSSRWRRNLAGLRPFRHGCPRLEVEHLGEKIVAHNYGHGGSGITMSWGSCAEVLSLLEPWLSSPASVAVLGAGIMGLCAASLLLDAGHSVTIHAAHFPPHTTSDVAGGLWAPTHVGVGDGPHQFDRHERILRTSWNAFQALVGSKFGVQEVPLFEADDRAYALDQMPSGLVDPPERLDVWPFTGRQPTGQVSTTLLIETPRFLRVLLAEVRDRGGRTREVVLREEDWVAQVEESLVVNCLGLGAGKVMDDAAVMPIRGQLVLMDPAPRPFVLDHANGYVISRSDVLVLGGTFEEGVDDPRPDEQTCARILEDHRNFFGCSAR